MALLTKIPQLLTIILLWLAASNLCLAQEKKKIEYAMLLDNTGSMRSQFELVKEIGKSIAHQTCTHGPVSLFVFESEGVGPGKKALPTVRLERSQDEGLLMQAIDNSYVEGGQTTLLDAIELISDHLHQKSGDADKVVVLITDGEERSSQIKKKALFQKLKDLKVKVFAVGLVEELDSERGLIQRSRSKATDLLKSLAKETGGRVVFPKTARPDLQKLLSELAIPIP